MTIWKHDETYRIIEAMKATGNHPGIVECWKKGVEVWAETNFRIDPNASAVKAWLPFWQPRPLYTADELAPIWPALAIALGITDRWPEVLKSARRLGFELDFYKLPHFEIRGQKYYVVEQIHFWKTATQEELENAVFG